MLTHYEALNVSDHATTEEIKQQFQQLILEYHPDKQVGQSAQDTDRVHRILEAWNVLKDPQRRQQYDADQRLRNGSKAVQAEIDLDDMDYDEVKDAYSSDCRCSAKYVITTHDLEEGVNVIECEQCSLRVRILYDVIENEDQDA